MAAGVSVHDSDYAQVIVVGGGRLAALAIRPDRADQALAHDPESFAHWSWATPRPLSAADAQQLSQRVDVFVEETVDELFDQLGLPAPYNPLDTGETTTESIGAAGFGGYLAPLGFMGDTTVVGPQRAAWRELRHVPGLGQGFLGIWDRESPDEPVATFVVSRRGEARLRQELERLQPAAGASGGWHERFDPVDGSASIGGERLAAAVFEGEEVVGVVVVAEQGSSGEASAYLVRPGDGIRHVYSLETVSALTAMLERYLGDVELSEWIPLADDAPDDPGGLARLVLTLAGL